MEIGLCYPERNWPSGSGENRKTHRRKLRGAVIVFLGMMLLLSGRKAYGAEVIHQSGMALQPYDTVPVSAVHGDSEPSEHCRFAGREDRLGDVFL